jgi:hypothetical protein
MSEHETRSPRAKYSGFRDGGLTTSFNCGLQPVRLKGFDPLALRVRSPATNEPFGCSFGAIALASLRG